MKKAIFILTLTIFNLFGCKTVELESYLYDASDFKEPGIVYNLPKNYLKIEITYTSRQEFQKINGIDVKNTNVEPVVTIDKPIKISSILVPDEDYTFRLSGKRISNDFFTKSTLDFNLTQNGILKSIDSDVDDESVEFGENLILATSNVARAVGSPVSALNFTDVTNFSKSKTFSTAINLLDLKSSDKTAIDRLALEFDKLNLAILKDNKTIVEKYDQELYDEIKLLNKKLITEDKKENINNIKTKISHLQSQIDAYQSKNRFYFKTTDIKYTAIIDPFHLYTRNELMTKKVNVDYSHTINPQYLFPDHKTNTIPKVKIVISRKGNKSPNSNPFKKNSMINGVVVRHPASSKIDLEVNDKLLASEVVFLGQLGNTSILPVKVKRGGKVVTAIKFDQATGAIAQHKIEASSSSGKIGKSLTKNSQTLQETIDYLNYEKGIKELTARKQELTLGNEITKLQDTELDKQLEDLTKQEQILLLQKKIDEINVDEEDNSAYDQALRDLQQKQKLLEIEVLIKELQDRLDNNN